MPYGPGTYGSKVGRPPKKKRQDGGLTLAQTGKAMNMQAPTSFIPTIEPQKTMLYGGITAKKEPKRMMQGGSAGKGYYGRAYGPIQKGLLRKASRRSY